MYMATGLNTALPVRASVSLVLPWFWGPSFSQIADLDVCDPQRQSEKSFGNLFSNKSISYLANEMQHCGSLYLYLLTKLCKLQ